MAVVTVQVGQCGNQLGSALFSALVEEADAGPDDFKAATRELFFRPRHRSDGAACPPLTARAVLVDMEPKVVAAAVRAAPQRGWGYDERSVLTFESGSGNNWARGYNTYGPRFRERACELVRREAEACDQLGGFLLLQSMAGGTGAGLGTYLVEALRDEHPSACVLSQCVWPYETGEVIVQNYNTLFTLASLLDAADGVLVVQNEALHAAAHTLLHVARPTLEDLNGIAARALAAALLPARWRPAASCGSTQRLPAMLFADAATRLCSHPAQRLLTLLSVPQMPARSVDFTTFTWPALLKRLRQMLVTGSTLEEGFDWSAAPGTGGASRCSAATLVLRGKDAALADVSMLADRALYAPWAPEPLRVACQPTRFGRCDMSATLLANAACAALPAQRMLSRAYAMYASRAYCHQYAAHSLELADFDAAFARVEDAVAAYGL